MCSEGDREVLKQNYGKNDRECVDRVKAVMNAYDVQSAYHACEVDTLQTVNTLISAIPDSRIVPVLRLLSDKLLKGYPVCNKHITSTNLLVWDHTKGWFSVTSTHPIAF